MKMTTFWIVAPCSLVEVADVSDVLAASIIRAMSTYCPDDGGSSFYQTTRRNNPEGSHPHIRRLENLKSHNFIYVYFLI
jgi:hypothetical protein